MTPQVTLVAKISIKNQTGPPFVAQWCVAYQLKLDKEMKIFFYFIEFKVINGQQIQQALSWTSIFPISSNISIFFLI